MRTLPQKIFMAGQRIDIMDLRQLIQLKRKGLSNRKVAHEIIERQWAEEAFRKSQSATLQALRTSEERYRSFRLYLASAALQFERGALSNFQALLVKPAGLFGQTR